MKRNYFLFDSYFTKIFVFWFLILTAGNATAQSATIEDISIDDSVAYQTQRIANKEIPTFYVTKGTFIVNNEGTNADIVTIPNKVNVRNVKSAKSEQKKVDEGQRLLKEEVVKYRKQVIENKVVFSEDHQSSESFSNNTVFSKNIILPQYNSGKLKAVLAKNTSYYTLRISDPYVEQLLETIFADNLFSENFRIRPPPTFSSL